MRIMAVIPARYESSRFPGKPLAKLLGRPMIAWVVEAAKKAGSLSGVCVATDHEGIARAAEEAGALVRMTDPALPSGTDRVAAAALTLNADAIINVQGDEPLTDPRDLDNLAALFTGGDPPRMATLAREARPGEDVASPDVVKVVRAANLDALYFSRSPIPFPRDGESYAPTLVHLGIYAYTRESLAAFTSLGEGRLERTEKLEQLRALEAGWKIKVIDAVGTRGLGVDRPEDIARAEALLASG